MQAGTAWRLWPRRSVLSLILLIAIASAGADEIDDLLSKADNLKSVDYQQFVATIQDLDRRSADLSVNQQHYLRFLDAWHLAYDSDYAAAIPLLRRLGEEIQEPNLRFRVLSTIVNVLAISKRYEEAFARLDGLLKLLPEVTDQTARQQGLGVASYLYAQVGLEDLALKFGDQVAQEDWAGRGICRGAELRFQATQTSERVIAVDSEVVDAVNACIKAGDLMRANFVRAYAAMSYIRHGKYDNALALLDGHREEVQKTSYRQLISLHDSLLARIYREKGEPRLVQEHATSAINNSIKGEYTEPLVTSYRLLYLQARERGDLATALEYHEHYAAADKAYLDELSARQLAYEKVKHQSLANELQIDTLNKEKEVLELQQALDKKAVEASRLYIVVLVLIAGFIALFAYRTKRSQLHFMKLSQQDGLTGIANRPHFIRRAEESLASNRKNDQEVCVVLCDLDHFKGINDRYGHAAGDSVLRHVVAEIRRHLRANDIFGRVGGEEFGVLLPGCSLEAARERCEQLRTALAALTIRLDETEIYASASFGIETTASCGYDLRQLLANADAALYQAKDAGRDRIVTYHPSMANTFTSMTTGRFRASNDRFNQDFAVHTK
ncbi:GGDEF domain-containing protein [Povalibacter sp.]|uniref:GGDEF domain-containing protein n=1 Tax=Povalibacter sp. TaxID=1962978 RepID=UPI002F3E784F